MKVIPLPGPVVINANMPAEELKALEATFDQIIDQLPGLIEVVDKSRINVNGTQGWYYLYKFEDKEMNKTGIHFRYFLFEGDTEYVVTFQVFPEEHYSEMAPQFDRVIETFDFKLGKPSPRPSGSESPAAEASPSPSS